MKNVLISGASGHSKMIIDAIHKNNSYNIIGFIDSYKEDGETIYGYEIIGSIADLKQIKEEHNIYGIIIGVGDNFTRNELKNKIDDLSLGLEFPSVIHPSAIIAKDIIIPEGTVIMPSVVINANAKIGRFCILNTATSLGHDCVMADFSSLASGATVGGNVTIGFASAICLKASIIQNISIGDHTVIGAASLVLKSIGDLKQAVGVPIHTIKDREPNSKYLG
ncbi:acetyltransferase [Winogradskyella sp.]|nr:acetyltransferase [Winogradskyella sp.]MDC1505879.1 acetyltransferase [Winogradskyella sp.]